MPNCPVCGYDGLPRGPVEGVICPSCGVQFGYNDAGPLPPWKMHEKIRQKWIAHGAQWYSSVVAQPPNWNPWDQLIKAKLGTDLPWHGSISEKVSESLTEVVQTREFTLSLR